MGYPTAIYTPRTMVNRPGVLYDALQTKRIYAEDFNLDRDEIVAIENALGVALSKVAVLAGQAGGQVLNGGNASGNNLTLMSTSHATKGKILFGASCFDEVNNRLGIGILTPSYPLHLYSASNLDIKLQTINTDGQIGFRLENDAVQFRFYVSASDDFIISNITTPKSLFTIKDTAPENSMLIANEGIGLGITSPEAVLHIKAGTSSNPPIKLTAGTNLGTPEAGSIEFDGTNLYITQSDGTRKTLAFA